MRFKTRKAIWEDYTDYKSQLTSVLTFFLSSHHRQFSIVIFLYCPELSREEQFHGLLAEAVIKFNWEGVVVLEKLTQSVFTIAVSRVLSAFKTSLFWICCLSCSNLAFNGWLNKQDSFRSHRKKTKNRRHTHTRFIFHCAASRNERRFKQIGNDHEKTARSFLLLLLLFFFNLNAACCANGDTLGMTLPATTGITPMRESPGSQACLSLRSTLLHRSKIREI